MEQLITIEILGQSYTFGTETEVSKAKEVADLLLKEVAKVEIQLSGKSTIITKQTILILAALNIAGENYKLKKKYSELLQDISERSDNLIRLVDTCLY
ncbi:cell division protein ZapA [Desulfonema magnum]|uniref:Cell division protein ZapA domain-containing protein n=1 Tax=Desulfonema magnum TaxID=45655 RepID=A0A975BX80_9BACT|nr:cell division protein ZapA [Desulfonema magnum]QTA93197.1 Cell division protein ZapA domain-containing protein [Desulfonema magnum]